jgi:CHAT domain-containing protein
VSAGAPLPGADDEIGAIALLYPHATVLSGTAATYRAAFGPRGPAGRIVHIAGHTEPQAGEEEHALRFGDGQRATWATIAAEPLDSRTVVVLAACETLRSSPSSGVRSLSLGGAFAAAGAGSVIGTLTPIADADARDLFVSIHRHLAAGLPPAQALRRAQLEALAGRRLPSWRSIAVLTRCLTAAPTEGGQPWARS